MSADLPADWPDEWEACPACNPRKRIPDRMSRWCSVCLPRRPLLRVYMNQVTRQWHLDRDQLPGWVTAAEAVRLALVPERRWFPRVRYE